MFADRIFDGGGVIYWRPRAGTIADLLKRRGEVDMTDFSGNSDVSYYPSGNIQSYRSTQVEEFAMCGAFFVSAEGSLVELYDNGSLRSLILGLPVRFKKSGVIVKLSAGDRVEFTEDGELVF